MATDFTAGMAGVLARFEAQEARMLQASDDATTATADDAVAFAKANAPWTDRTGDARDQLHAEIGTTVNGMRFTVAHGVPYGIDLENAHGSRFAILGPTMATFQPVLQSRLRDIWHV